MTEAATACDGGCSPYVAGALRVFVSLQQRLWADISASTSAVHGIFNARRVEHGALHAALRRVLHRALRHALHRAWHAAWHAALHGA